MLQEKLVENTRHWHICDIETLLPFSLALQFTFFYNIFCHSYHLLRIDLDTSYNKVYYYRDFSVGDAFVGYHEDTIPSIVMQVCNDMEEDDDLPDETTEDTSEMKVRG